MKWPRSIRLIRLIGRIGRIGPIGPISPIGLISPIGPIRPISPISPISLISFIALFALLSCSSPLSPDQQAALAAEGYYRHLLAGEYDQFLEGRAGADSLPDSYREQLLTGYRQFMAQQQEKHDGITAVSVSNVRTDSLDHYTSVFLLLCYGDSTQEEIVVPMVEHNGSWRMK
jgi:hypothetical protein